jgi:hypothetical protein
MKVQRLNAWECSKIPKNQCLTLNIGIGKERVTKKSVGGEHTHLHNNLQNLKLTSQILLLNHPHFSKNIIFSSKLPG